MLKIKLGFTGDFCTMYRMESLVKNRNWGNSFESIIPFFAENDANILDLEAPLTNSNIGINKSGPVIKMLPESTELLKALNCQLVATANNHLMDYDKAGLLDTYEHLNHAGIDFVGSGLNMEAASKFKVIEIKETKIAIINITENEWSTTHGNKPGCNPIDPVTNFGQIKAAKEQADFVIVIAHGGHENYPLPTLRIKQLYHFFIEAGADAVIGHHTHIVSGFEIVNNCPIFYSLGNFCFDWPEKRNAEWNKGMLLRLIIEKGKPLSFDYQFINQNDDKPGVYLEKKENLAEREKRIASLNHIIKNNDLLEQTFYEYASGKSKVARTLLEPYSGKILPSLHKKGILPSLMSKRKITWLKNIIQCESHRELLLEGLKKY